MQHRIVHLDLQTCQAGVILITSKLHVDVIPEIYRSGVCFYSPVEVCHASGCISC